MPTQRFERQPETLRPTVAGKRLENQVNQWLARRRLAELRWRLETGPRTPLGGPDAVLAVILDYREAADGDTYQVKAFLSQAALPAGTPAAAYKLESELQTWIRYTRVRVVDRFDIKLGSTVLEAWLLACRPGQARADRL